MKSNVGLRYVFVDDKLIQAIYRLEDNYLNSNRFRSTYTKFKSALIKKYGQPTKGKTNWINDAHKNNPNKWGLALSLGHVEYASSWRTQSTNIKCSLKEENFYVLCLIEYWSKEYSNLISEINREDNQIGFKPVDKIDPM